MEIKSYKTVILRSRKVTINVNDRLWTVAKKVAPNKKRKLSFFSEQ